MALLDVNHLDYARGTRTVLSDVTFTLEAGEFLGVVGPNGAGKSSLLRIIAGLSRASAGTVALDGLDVSRLSSGDRARRIGYHPQRPELHWPLTVENLVALGRIPHGGGPGHLTSADRDAIADALARCGLEHAATRRADELSGGELARAHMARLFAGRHRLVLADEPIANLDPRFQLEVLAALRMQAAQGAAIVVLHDLNIAARHCDRLLLLAGGSIAAWGEPAAVLTGAHVSAAFGVAPSYLVDAGISQAVAARAGAMVESPSPPHAG